MLRIRSTAPKTGTSGGPVLKFVMHNFTFKCYIFQIEGTMQIFVINVEGKSFRISVESEDTIKSVKEKIEDNQGVPVLYQCLVFNGKPLMDELTIRHNIEKESNLRINMHAWEPTAYEATHGMEPVVGD